MSAAAPSSPGGGGGGCSLQGRRRRDQEKICQSRLPTLRLIKVGWSRRKKGSWFPRGVVQKLLFLPPSPSSAFGNFFAPSRKKGGRNSKVALNECQKSKMERKRLGVLKDRIQFSPPAPRRIARTPLGGSGILCWGGGGGACPPVRDCGKEGRGGRETRVASLQRRKRNIGLDNHLPGKRGEGEAGKRGCFFFPFSSCSEREFRHCALAGKKDKLIRAFPLLAPVCSAFCKPMGVRIYAELFR